MRNTETPSFALLARLDWRTGTTRDQATPAAPAAPATERPAFGDLAARRERAALTEANAPTRKRRAKTDPNATRNALAAIALGW